MKDRVRERNDRDTSDDVEQAESMLCELAFQMWGFEDSLMRLKENSNLFTINLVWNERAGEDWREIRLSGRAWADLQSHLQRMKDKARERNDRGTWYDLDQAESMLHGLAVDIWVENSALREALSPVPRIPRKPV